MSNKKGPKLRSLLNIEEPQDVDDCLISGSMLQDAFRGVLAWESFKLKGPRVHVPMCIYFGRRV